MSHGPFRDWNPWTKISTSEMNRIIDIVERLDNMTVSGPLQLTKGPGGYALSCDESVVSTLVAPPPGSTIISTDNIYIYDNPDITYNSPTITTNGPSILTANDPYYYKGPGPYIYDTDSYVKMLGAFQICGPFLLCCYEMPALEGPRINNLELPAASGYPPIYIFSTVTASEPLEISGIVPPYGPNPQLIILFNKSPTPIWLVNSSSDSTAGNQFWFQNSDTPDSGGAGLTINGLWIHQNGYIILWYDTCTEISGTPIRAWRNLAFSSTFGQRGARSSPGLVPDPAEIDEQVLPPDSTFGDFFLGDSGWRQLNGMIGAGSGHRTGVVPDTGATAHTPPYALCDDATWKKLVGVKGDLLTSNGTALQQLALGTNGQVLTVDNTTALGLKWAAGGGGGGTPTAVIDFSGAAYNGAGNTNVPNNTWTNLNPAPSLVYDTDGFTTAFKAPVAGVYGGVFKAGANGATTFMALRVITSTGQMIEGPSEQLNGTGITQYMGGQVYWEFNLAANETVSCQAYQTSGGTAPFVLNYQAIHRIDPPITITGGGTGTVHRVHDAGSAANIDPATVITINKTGSSTLSSTAMEVSQPTTGEAQLALYYATPTHDGIVSTTTQTFAGQKGFKDGVGPLTVYGLNSNNYSIEFIGSGGDYGLRASADALYFYSGGTLVAAYSTTGAFTSPTGGAFVGYFTGCLHNFVYYGGSGPAVGAFGTTQEGDIVQAGIITAIGVSDASLKHVVGQVEGALEVVQAVAPVKFQWDEEACKKVGGRYEPGEQIGFRAQDLAAVCPQLARSVGREDSNLLTLNLPAVIAVLWQSVKELNDRLTSMLSEQ